MRPFAFALIALAFVASTQSPAAAAYQAAQPYPDAPELARRLQHRLPMDLGNNVRAIAIAAEGQILVWTIDVPAATIAGATPEDLARPLTEGFCSGAGAEMFNHGVSLRVDTTSNGSAPVRGVVISRCPGT